MIGGNRACRRDNSVLLADLQGDRGEAEEFEQLYERFRLPIYRTIRGIVLDGPLAEDLTQETFERAFRARSSVHQVASVGAWLHRIAVNAALSHLRRQRLARLLPSKLLVGGQGSGLEEIEDRSLAARALAALSPKLRAVVILTYYSGMTREEVARALRIPPGTVASRLGAALQVMRRAVAETDQQELAQRQGSVG